MATNILVKEHAHAISTARDWTLMFLGDDASPDQLLHTVYEGGPHILWLAGHCAVTLDGLVNELLGGRPVLDAATGALFGPGAKPSPDATLYPGFDEVRVMLEETRVRAMEVLGGMDDSRLEEALDGATMAGRIFRTVGGLLLRVPFHECYHAGQITLLRRAQGLPSRLGL